MTRQTLKLLPFVPATGPDLSSNEMRKPEDSLNDFTIKAEKAVDPPRAVSLRFGGEVEVLRPLGRQEDLANPNPDPATGNPFVRPGPNRFSWFQSAVAAAAVLGMMVVMLLSAIFISLTDPSASPDIATADTAINPNDPQYADGSTQPEVRNDSEIFGTQNFPLEWVMIPERPTIAKVSTARRARKAFRLRRQPRQPRIVVTTFVPTTLIIYPENGEIKSRIEPQLTAVYKGPLTISN